MWAILLVFALVCCSCCELYGFSLSPVSYQDAQQSYYEVLTHCEQEGGECKDVDFGGPSQPESTDFAPSIPPPTPRAPPPPAQPLSNILPVSDPFVPFVPNSQPPILIQQPVTAPPLPTMPQFVPKLGPQISVTKQPMYSTPKQATSKPMLPPLPSKIPRFARKMIPAIPKAASKYIPNFVKPFMKRFLQRTPSNTIKNTFKTGNPTMPKFAPPEIPPVAQWKMSKYPPAGAAPQSKPVPPNSPVVVLPRSHRLIPNVSPSLAPKAGSQMLPKAGLPLGPSYKPLPGKDNRLVLPAGQQPVPPKSKMLYFPRPAPPSTATNAPIAPTVPKIRRKTKKGKKTRKVADVEKELPESRQRRAVGQEDPIAKLSRDCLGGWEFDLGCGSRNGNVCCYPASARRRK